MDYERRFRVRPDGFELGDHDEEVIAVRVHPEYLAAQAIDPERAERARWDDYQDAFQAALRATSTEHAPWYVIPADHKWFMRTAVAAILVHHLEALDPRFPALSSADRAAMREAVAALEAE
jgi:hypothetical protein